MSELTVEKMRQAVRALRHNAERHQRLMSTDEAYRAIWEGRACPLMLPVQ